jgi:sugar lactone lactonase YvrE
LLAFDEDGSHVQLLIPVEKEVPGNRMNDAKCDSRGRLWVGTFSTSLERDAGRVYRIDGDHSVTEIFAGVHISNGFAWNLDETLLYFNDTGKRLTYVFDYEIETGTASNRRVFLKFGRDEGMPDGMCADAEGCLWIALYGGSVVRRYSPKGDLLGVINLPVKAVTSCCFGGPDLRDLYITTAWHEPEWVKPPSPRELAGSLFCCRLDTGGLPAHSFSG